MSRIVKVILSEELFERLERCCEKQTRSRSNVLRHALGPYLSRSGFPPHKTGDNGLLQEATTSEGDLRP